MSGGKQISSYYFDSCIYLAYLNNEVAQYGKQRIHTIASLWSQSERGGILVLTSAITIIEVRKHITTAKGRQKFDQIIESGIHQSEDVTPPIADRASVYREFYTAHPVKNPYGDGVRSDLTTPDAIHLATAVIFGCDQFLTFDGIAAKKTIGLLWLKNKVANDELIISEPQLDHPELPLATSN